MGGSGAECWCWQYFSSRSRELNDISDLKEQLAVANISLAGTAQELGSARSELEQMRQESSSKIRELEKELQEVKKQSAQMETAMEIELRKASEVERQRQQLLQINEDLQKSLEMLRDQQRGALKASGAIAAKRRTLEEEMASLREEKVLQERRAREFEKQVSELAEQRKEQMAAALRQPDASLPQLSGESRADKMMNKEPSRATGFVNEVTAPQIVLSPRPQAAGFKSLPARALSPPSVSKNLVQSRKSSLKTAAQSSNASIGSGVVQTMMLTPRLAHKQVANGFPPVVSRLPSHNIEPAT